MLRFADLFGLRCVCCGRPGAQLCAGCEAGLRPPPDGAHIPVRVLAAFSYEATARRLILGLKLSGTRSCAGPLATGIARRVMDEGLAADAVTWVPGRRADIRRRGFDHAAVLCRAVGRTLGLPAVPLLHRTGPSRDQASLTRSERLANHTGTFEAGSVSLRVALIDDLVTTGATAVACRTALQQAGAPSVEVIVAARA